MRGGINKSRAKLDVNPEIFHGASVLIYQFHTTAYKKLTKISPYKGGKHSNASGRILSGINRAPTILGENQRYPGYTSKSRIYRKACLKLRSR